ncbi:hypothetical protein E2C01_067165 [Portunus trituberculatus]|uniref:Uncharacterized protein n=1 Tax=Portunus trituberculatus TaxID=210409 RepID=A0A5B7HK91_PORTR|nr:hypothetical protein [Portunus trituberculatus]
MAVSRMQATLSSHRTPAAALMSLSRMDEADRDEAMSNTTHTNTSTCRCLARHNFRKRSSQPPSPLMRSALHYKLFPHLFQHCSQATMGYHALMQYQARTTTVTTLCVSHRRGIYTGLGYSGVDPSLSRQLTVPPRTTAHRPLPQPRPVAAFALLRLSHRPASPT